MRIIGDVHGKHEEYHRIIVDVSASVQVGDFGFNWSTNKKNAIKWVKTGTFSKDQ